MGVCYRSPSQNDDADKLFFEELQETSKTTALVLMGDFNLPEINWEHHSAGKNQARGFLKNLDDNSMEQILREPTHKDLLVVNRVDLMSKVRLVTNLATVTTRICCALKRKHFSEFLYTYVKLETRDREWPDIQLVAEGSDRVGLVGTWDSASVNPLQLGVVVAKVQDPALGLVESHPVGISPTLQSAQVPLRSPPAFQLIYTPLQLGVILFP
ncbi:hypothetical protein BTVI_09530 [Pitangus sulphuratus]|nr:hypothetical protein BTVI_09530 [Pitangus sulphuratus]